MSDSSLLSNHLLMRWLTTPAMTAIIKEAMISIKTPPPVARYRQDNTNIITYLIGISNDDFLLNNNFLKIRLYLT